MKKGLIAVFALAMLLLGSTVTPASARDRDFLRDLGGVGLGLGLGALGAGVYGNYGGYYNNPYVGYPAYGYGSGYYPDVNLYTAPTPYYGYYGNYFY
ncbi:MAG TPA: hypothetical protein V6D22_21315 [Candidatus Obscuribacterales bacterium]